MIPARYGPVLFSFILSGVMSLLVSGISTFRAVPVDQGFWGLWGLWAGAWLTGWLFAFPAVMLAAPLARKVVARIVAVDG
ncbi:MULTISPECIES: DUF2798 domain-containing protein [unclassified Acidovorax]|jgi:hypothetical protein|uniref:DUF2798 domain-containing protein n=1 Tax=unclassified Acidovorax TaxID=2684926 RepID=UPI000BD7D6A2|nr:MULTISPECIES: DUF2798 domain-containing protein [unclassified Acidovorax]OZA58101.1 MAG: hypothetical protein B7X79_03865 [Acidovorax sp. 17-64-282]HQS22639.1 DUF2798 domain-containing protein [Acidovorax defluvii]OYY26209.1 MAG: hypothetical protein B7Y64_16765 [Acidovorax sp. 35-64-16]OYY85994.1 MAG: hypothetical protein B7Y46_07110 [Acidovorax sp. 28-64-14]OYZ44683.1 MAG: hypothetical protein B7Y20_10115 [Acidovorax sp. 16-64-162]